MTLLTAIVLKNISSCHRPLYWFMNDAEPRVRPASLNHSHLLVAGDMNVALGPLDYKGSRPTHSNIKDYRGQ